MPSIRKKIPQSFFERSAVLVARDLIGCMLVSCTPAGTMRHMITETEAYEGPHDRASHAFRGRTKRTEVMYHKAGTIYVYLIYGMHHMLNIVTGALDYPAAVLIRGVEGIIGPGKITKSIAITRTINTLPLGTKANLWIEFPPAPQKLRIMRTPRIGIDYAGPIWANKKYRFVLKK